MTSSLDVRQKQRAVIEFLVSEGEPPKQIFERLVNVYGDASLAYSTVKKWVSRIKHEEDDPSLSSLQDRPRSGRPSSAVNPGNNDKVEKLIRDDRRITIDDIAECVEVSHGSAVNIVNELGFAKVCARWVPRQLLDFHKQARFEACSELIECHRSDKTFLSRIVTGDETGFITMNLCRKDHPWNGVTPCPQEPRNSKVNVQLEKLWRLCFGTLKE